MRQNEAEQQQACDSIVKAGKLAAARGWVPATSGNFSVRTGAQLAVTKSGRDKGALCADDVALFPAQGEPPAGLSAEAALHIERYRAVPAIGAIFHVHAPHAVALSHLHRHETALCLQGWELQKAFAGVGSHEQELLVPIFANTQDVPALACQVEAYWREFGQALRAGPALAPGYLIVGHGLYAWGRDAAEAWRHLEAFDALFHGLLLTTPPTARAS